MKLIFNILAVCGSGIFAGGMLVIGVVVGGFWKSLEPLEFTKVFTQQLPFIMTVLPIMILPTIVGLVGSTWMDWKNKHARFYLLCAIGCFSTFMLLTAVWFGPVNAKFMENSQTAGQIFSLRNQWLSVHYVRIVLATMTTVLGFIGVSDRVRARHL